jgi:hypothetical protein
MNDEFDERLDRALVRALERRPQPAIPADFAARVAAIVPRVKAPARVRTMHYGRTAMVAAMIALLVALTAMAPRANPESLFGIAMEYLLCAQFIGVGIWWAVREPHS